MINIKNIQKFATNATTSASSTITRSMPDTLADARLKVVNKLNSNIAYINNDMQIVNSEKVDLVFKQANNNTYKVGVKYGNRWLKNMLGKNNSFIDGVARTELVDVLNALISEIESKQADDAITVIMQANVAAHSKAA